MPPGDKTDFSDAVLKHLTRMDRPLVSVVKAFSTGFPSEAPIGALEQLLESLASLDVPSSQAPGDRRALRSLNNISKYVTVQEQDARVSEASSAAALPDVTGSRGHPSFLSWLTGSGGSGDD
jgi:hypothetical protein